MGSVEILKPLNRLTQKLAWVITSAISPRMPKFKAITPVGAYRHMDEISLSRGFYFFSFFVTQILLTSRGQTVEPIFTLFESLDDNPRLLHS